MKIKCECGTELEAIGEFTLKGCKITEMEATLKCNSCGTNNLMSKTWKQDKDELTSLRQLFG